MLNRRIKIFVFLVFTIIAVFFVVNNSDFFGMAFYQVNQGVSISKNSEINEKRWLSTIFDDIERKKLIESFEQTRNASKRDVYGNIIKEIDGQKRTLLGYPFQKALYLESITQSVSQWPELKKLKDLPIPKAYSSDLSDEKISSINNLTSVSKKPSFKQNDACFIEEKPNNFLDKSPENNLCVKYLFQNGAKKISPAMQQYYCTGIYRGIPILQSPYQKYFIVPFINTSGNVGSEANWSNFCLNDFQQIKTQKQEDWTDEGEMSRPLTFQEVKKCINSNDHSDFYDKWFDNSCYQPEICDNNIDDDSNGTTDCADGACSYFVTMDNLKRDAICLDKEREFCGKDGNQNGTVKSMYGPDILCFDNGPYKSWAECDANGESKKKGEHGIIKNEGDIINTDGCNYICVQNGQYKESWVGCGCNKGPNGLNAKEGESYSGYKCNQFNWVSESQYTFVDNLNSINPLFHRADYDLQGFMYWAYDLYQKGSFPLLPYLTPVKQQGERGTCLFFADTAAAEIVLLNRADLSEQNFTYLSIAENSPQAQEDIDWLLKNGINAKFLSSKIQFNIGNEKEWPYNPSKCQAGFYYSELLKKNIPCSNQFHQGIPTANPNVFQQYGFIKDTQNGVCVTAQSLDADLKTMSTDQKIAYLANIINVQHYPIRFGTDYGSMDSNDIGFTTESFWVKGSNPHAMLIVGFVNKDDIPEAVKKHYHFMKNEHYFIIKNSYGAEAYDGGFLYAPASLLVENTRSRDAFKYDKNGEVYSSCPSQKVTMQIKN